MAGQPTRSFSGVDGSKGMPVQFTLSDAERINAAVLKSENGRRQPKGSTLPKAAPGGAVVVGIFTGSWFKNEHKAVSMGATLTAATTNVLNVSCNIVAYSSVTAARCLVTNGLLLSHECVYP
jgi:hypothetical protein